MFTSSGCVAGPETFSASGSVSCSSASHAQSVKVYFWSPHGIVLIQVPAVPSFSSLKPRVTINNAPTRKDAFHSRTMKLSQGYNSVLILLDDVDGTKTYLVTISRCTAMDRGGEVSNVYRECLPQVAMARFCPNSMMRSYQTVVRRRRR